MSENYPASHQPAEHERAADQSAAQPAQATPPAHTPSTNTPSLSRRRFVTGLAGVGILAGTGSFFTSARLTAGGYSDRAQVAANQTLQAFVPLGPRTVSPMWLGKTGIGIDANNRAITWGLVGAGSSEGSYGGIPGEWGAGLAGVATSSVIEKTTGYPRQIFLGPSNPKVIDVQSNKNTALALDQNGSIWAWGTGGYLIPGSTNTSPTGYAPQRILAKAGGSPLTGIKAIAAAYAWEAVALDSAGKAWRWGQVYLDASPTLYPTPVALPNTRVERIFGGLYGAGAVLENGDVYYWTRVQYPGQIPNNQDVSSGTPTRITGLVPWNKANSPNAYILQVCFVGGTVDVAGFGVALLSNGTLLSWGASPEVAGHNKGIVPTVTADSVVSLHPSQFAVHYLRQTPGPNAGYELWGYGGKGQAGVSGTSTHTKIDTGVVAVWPGRGRITYQKIDASRALGSKILALGATALSVDLAVQESNSAGALGLNSTGTAIYTPWNQIHEPVWPTAPAGARNLDFLIT